MTADRSPSTDATPEPWKHRWNGAHEWMGPSGEEWDLTALDDRCSDCNATPDAHNSACVECGRAWPCEAEQQRQRADVLAGIVKSLVRRAAGHTPLDVGDHRTYALHIEEAFIDKARAALQAASGTTRDEPGLDVERLARAIQSTILTSPDEYRDEGMGAYRTRWVNLTDRQKRHVLRDAQALAAEYARLATPDSTSKP